MAPPAAVAPTSTRRTVSSQATDRASQKRAEDEELRPYVIVSDLGKGSFATVYRGYHEVRNTCSPEMNCSHEDLFMHIANTQRGRYQDRQPERPHPETV